MYNSPYNIYPLVVTWLLLFYLSSFVIKESYDFLVIIIIIFIVFLIYKIVYKDIKLKHSIFTFIILISSTNILIIISLVFFSLPIIVPRSFQVLFTNYLLQFLGWSCGLIFLILGIIKYSHFFGFDTLLAKYENIILILFGFIFSCIFIYLLFRLLTDILINAKKINLKSKYGLAIFIVMIVLILVLPDAVFTYLYKLSFGSEIEILDLYYYSTIIHYSLPIIDESIPNEIFSLSSIDYEFLKIINILHLYTTKLVDFIFLVGLATIAIKRII